MSWTFGGGGQPATVLMTLAVNSGRGRDWGSDNMTFGQFRMLRNFGPVRTGGDAIRIPHRSRLDSSIGANRTACADVGLRDLSRGRVRYCRTPRVAYANRDSGRLTAARPPSVAYTHSAQYVRARACRHQSATTLLARSDPAQPLSTAEIIFMVAGRLPPSAECPTHSKALVSTSLPA